MSTSPTTPATRSASPARRTDAVAARPEPLTASFEGLPAEHAGQGSFSFRVAFSEGINISYKTVRDASFTGDGR